MVETLLTIIVVLLAVVLILQILSLVRKVGVNLAPLEGSLEAVEKGQQRTEGAVRDEIQKNRSEAGETARLAREELNNLLRGFAALSNQQHAALVKSNEEKLEQFRSDAVASAKGLREEVGGTLKGFNDSVVKTMGDLAHTQRVQLAEFREQLTRLGEASEKKFDTLKAAVEERLKSLQEDNSKNLEQMRQTVDEKLQGTLEKRLGESFKLVSERLEQVHKGLGEMQNLANGVGDLKRVLTNVKTRGTWGEIQLASLLEQILTADQYSINVATKDALERVEFTINLPGRSDDSTEVVWLPIDSKFPLEDYQRLVDAQEAADPEAAETAGKQLEIRIKLCARDICEKYLNPPKTTDFAIMFLPTEGLYAEVIRRNGLVENLQRECRVVIAGPTTLAALLNSLQMGFRTLAIQQRSSEVWNLLAAVKSEFGKYGEVLKKVQKKLQEASNTIDTAETRTRVIQRKLKNVQELPAADVAALLGDGPLDAELDAELAAEEFEEA